MCAGVAPLSARPLEKEIPVSGSVCYERIYDAAHLKAHPKQEVTRFKLDLTSNRQENGEEMISAIAEISVKGKSAPYDLSAVCKPKGSGLNCIPEWDAGTYSITRDGDGSLLVTNNKMIFNPYDYDTEDQADGAITLRGDDKAWRLYTNSPCAKGAARITP